mmetsp:Transcript_14097/g.19560  ORF Transcript_14097/g.19560 Transcript_14097/m.19560 type:complete len:164 (-) Transcript_14097:1749-2240(-)
MRRERETKKFSGLIFLDYKFIFYLYIFSCILCFYLCLFTRMFSLVADTLAGLKERKGKMYNKRRKVMSRIFSKINQLLFLIITIGSFSAFWTFWRAAFDFKDRNNLSYSAYYNQTFGSKRWVPTHDLFLYVFAVFSSFWLFWAWVPLCPLRQNRVENEPSYRS